jgi:hypothetical protein
MTRSDPGHPNQDPGNPFDTGLPMLRMPATPTPKRRPSARASGQQRPPEAAAPEPQPYAAEPQPYSGEPMTPSDRSGDWMQWLDAPRPAAEFPDPEVDQSGYPAHHEETESDPYGDSDARAPMLVDRSGGSPGPRLRHAPRRQDQSRGNRLVAVLIVLGIVIAIASVITFALNSSGKRTPPPVAATTPAPAPVAPGSTTSAPGDQSSAVATPGCEQRRTPDVVSGTDPGGTTDGPSAILAFERAYYVQRSGFAARAVVANDATVPPADQIQRGIDQVPVGTLYCVLITRTATGVGDGQSHWEVRLTQQMPGQQLQTFTQIITTRTTAVRTLITAIAAG